MIPAGFGDGRHRCGRQEELARSRRTRHRHHNSKPAKSGLRRMPEGIECSVPFNVLSAYRNKELNRLAIELPAILLGHLRPAGVDRAVCGIIREIARGIETWNAHDLSRSAGLGTPQAIITHEARFHLHSGGVKRPAAGLGFKDRPRALTYHDAHHSWKSGGARGPPKPRAPCVAASACTVPRGRTRKQIGQARGITKVFSSLRKNPRRDRQHADCDSGFRTNADDS